MPESSIQTGGGSAVQGDVQVREGDFVGRDKIDIHVTWQGAPFVLAEPDLAQLRAGYLAYLRQAYQYLDFKGLPQVDKIAQQLALDAVYVPLRARAEVPAGDTWLRVAGRAWKGEAPDDESVAELAEAHGLLAHAEPVLADEALAQAPGLVILGDPGAGKSTLLKVLALGLARLDEGPLPILVPLNAYADALAREAISLHDFLPAYFATRQHRLKELGPLFDAALEAGQAVVLLDGLDEVQARRTFLVRLVHDFAAEHVPEPARGEEAVPGNRLVVTSRIVGYHEAPLDGARWRTYTLVDFGHDEIERFADRWTLAFETTTQGDTDLARAVAARERDELLAAIQANPGIERLASNPLLLTILALIKRQGVSLPQRRVELYELYLRTLINAWNKARSLDRRPVGPEMDYLETVQVLAPLGLWLRETNPTAGLVTRVELEAWLAGYYRREWELAPGPARREAREFLRAVNRYSNLLVERGQDQFGFLHLTFEEMLAAKGIAAQAQLGPKDAVDTILHYLDDPAWHETILLAVGALGVIAQQPLAAGEVLRSLCAAEMEGEARGQNVVTAGEALLDAGEVGVGRRAAATITACLVSTMQDPAAPARTRRQAGLVLGRLGWVPEDLDEWIEIEPGPFLYGDRRERRVIAHRYWIGKYPVTNLQFARFVDDGGYGRRELWSDEGWAWRTGTYDSQNPYFLKHWLADRPVEKRDRPFWWHDTRWNNPLFPVVGVSCFEAEAYGRWLHTQDPLPDAPKGYGVRLATEEESERAARGVDGREYPWGNEFDFRRLTCAEAWEGQDNIDWRDWIRRIPEFAATTAVCTHPQGAGPEGMWDTAGNVWEWTASRSQSGWADGVLRGGSWNFNQEAARCARRIWHDPGDYDNTVGLRVVVFLAPSDF
ncbi:MAG: SUMF1/EgtB/PvdO family nonheme iron enzyme [Anaerolineae bacterium]|nr:SUMF1/EgtB/PvdO family nonheme iron enzyme [Anaerolineae bacterium]